MEPVNSVPVDATASATTSAIIDAVCKSDKCTLIIDTRERDVTKHKEELSQINHVIKQLTVGDYCVLSPNGTIMAIIERKSLIDFAASFKDKRSENIQKMINLRAKTNCRILYIIEGKPFPQPTETFARVPYANIESSIFHLSVRDGVTVLRTKDTVSTAQMLVRFMRSMDTLTKDGDVDLAAIPTPAIGNVNSGGNVDGSGVNDDGVVANTATNKSTSNITSKSANEDESFKLLTATYKKTTLDIVRMMWGCFNNITVTSADNYIYTWTIKEIITRRIPKTTLSSFKLSSGKSISTKVVNSLLTMTPVLERKLLSAIPGISSTTASEMLANTDLVKLLELSADQLSQIKTGKSQRCIGDERAARIIECFNYKHVHVL